MSPNSSPVRNRGRTSSPQSTNSSPARSRSSQKHPRSSSATKVIRTTPHAARKNALGFPLFTTEHTPQNVAMYAFILGSATGAGVALRSTEAWALAPSAYVALVAVGMGLEYITRAMSRQEQGIRSFLIGGGVQENVYLILGLLEYAVRSYLFPQFAAFSAVSSVGVIIAVATQNIRTFTLIGLSSGPRDRLAMKIARHALTLWRLSTQLVLCNPLCLILQCIAGSSSVPAKTQPDHGLGPLGLPIFDGQHTPQNIAAHAYLIGVLHGVGLVLGLYSENYRGLGFFLNALAMFHILEYLMTAMYGNEVKISSFLLNNGREYQFAMIAGVIEYFVWGWLYPPMNIFRWWNYLAILLLLASQSLRSAAMCTAGANFTHLVADEKETHHTLVTSGVYSIFRHPSYTAFYYWALGTQLVASNPFSALAFALTLSRFFRSRIRYEEYTLLNFFGDRYGEYMGRTGVWIPGWK